MYAYMDTLRSRTLKWQISLMVYRKAYHVSWIIRWKWPLISNLHSSENAPAYTLAANEGGIKAMVNFYRDVSDSVFFRLSHDLRPSILKV